MVTALYRITLEFFMVIYPMAQDIRAVRERGDFRWAQFAAGTSYISKIYNCVI